MPHIQADICVKVFHEPNLWKSREVEAKQVAGRIIVTERRSFKSYFDYPTAESQG